jgi:cell division protein FtsB
MIGTAVLALVGVAGFFMPKAQQFTDYQTTKTELEAEIRIQQERINELRHNQEKFSTDKHFVQKIAHEIGYAHEGEIIYQFEEKPSTNNESRKTQVIRKSE